MTYPVVDAGHLHMATGESTQSLSPHRAGIPADPGGRVRWFLGAPLRREAWLAAAYLLIEFPIGIAAFVYATVMISVGAGTIIILLVGVALLVAFMYSLQLYGELQRALSNRLLGTSIPPLPFQGERGPLWSLARMKMRASNAMTWRLLAFLFVRFPLSIAGFVLLAVSIAVPLSFLAAPVTAEFGGDTLWADNWHEAIPLALLGPLLLILAFNGLQGAGWLSGWIARLFLQTSYAGISDEGPTVFERAKAAVGACSNPGAPVVLDDGAQPADGAPATATVAQRPVAAEGAQQGLMVDVAMRRVSVDGRGIELTPKEFDLLALFAQNPGRPFSRDELLDRIWRNDYEVTDRTIDTHVQRLRKKLGQQSAVIQTVWGVGYRFEDAQPQAEANDPRAPGDAAEPASDGW